MSLIILGFFLLFGLFFKTGFTYWRFLLFALAAALIGVNLPVHLASPMVVWIFSWPLPIALAFIGALRDSSTTPLARILFACIGLVACFFSAWQMFFVDISVKDSGPRPGVVTTVVEGKKKSSENIQSQGWEPLESDEGMFRVLSPLPASTVASFHDVGNFRLKVTTTRIKDTDPLCYVITTTHYPSDFQLPEEAEQASLAMQHLMKTYNFDKMIDVSAVMQAGYHGLRFEATNNVTHEQMAGLIIPTGSVLYQLLVLAPDQSMNKENAERFFQSFEPLKRQGPVPQGNVATGSAGEVH